MGSKELHTNILFTGLPGCGKSTLIERLVDRISRPCTGFFTREIRHKGRRAGFSINTLDGKEGVLAHVDFRSRYRVGRYGVNLKDIETIAVPSMVPENENAVVVIDEIGKMECFSEMFRRTLIKTLDSVNTVVGSISLKGNAFIGKIKARPDTHLITVTPKNRNSLVDIYLPEIILEK